MASNLLPSIRDRVQNIAQGLNKRVVSPIQQKLQQAELARINLKREQEQGLPYQRVAANPVTKAGFEYAQGFNQAMNKVLPVASELVPPVQAVKQLTGRAGNPIQRGKDVISAGLGAGELAGRVDPFQLATGAIAGGIEAARKGKDLKTGTLEGAANLKGFGSALTDNSKLATAIDVASFPVQGLSTAAFKKGGSLIKNIVSKGSMAEGDAQTVFKAMDKLVKNPQDLTETLSDDTERLRTTVEKLADDYLGKEFTKSASFDEKLNALNERARLDMGIDRYGAKSVNMNLVEDTKPTPQTVIDKADDALFSAKERGFVKTVRESANTAPEVASEVKGTYNPITNKDTLAQAQELIRTNVDQAISMVKNPKSNDALSNVVAQELMRQYQNAGRFNDAIDIAEETAKKATTAGQAIQALSIWNRLSPEGALSYATRVANKAGRTVPEETAKKITSIATELQSLPEGREKLIKTAKLLDEVSSTVPPSLLSKVSTLQTMAQLLNPKTAIRNVVGNALFSAGENVSQIVGTPIDMVLSLVTGKRTQALPNIGAQLKGGATGFKEGVEEALKGVDTLKLSSQFDLPKNSSFSNPVMKGIEKLMNLELKAPDRAFYKAAYEGSLSNLMKLAGTSTPTDEMKSIAHMDALYRTFQDDTALTKMFSGLKKSLNLGQDFGLGDLILKYPKTPASILSKAIDYSPMGLVTAIYHAAVPAFGKEFNQKAFIQAFSRAITGTGGLVTTGYLLNKLGIIEGRPTQDTDIKAVERASGLGSYKINVSALKRLALSGMSPEASKKKEGDVLVSYDWIQPFAIGISMGANISENGGKAKGVVDTILTSLSEGVETLADQPLVSGLKVFGQGKGITKAITETLKGAPSSFVPTVFSQVNQILDNSSRDTYDPDQIQESLNRAKAKIPGLAQQLPKRYDVFGKEVERYQNDSNNIFNVFLNPAFVSEVNRNPVAKEVLDIFERSGEKTQAPRVVPKKVKINGVDIQLNAKQMGDYQQYVGKASEELLGKMIAKPKWKELSDDDKAKVAAELLSEINSAAKIELFGNKPKSVSNVTKLVLKKYHKGNE